MKCKTLKKHRGYVEIHKSVIEDCPEAVMVLMSKMIVFKAEFNYMREVFVYEGLSSYFDELEEGEITPTYNVLFETNRFGDLFIKDVRRRD